jgi:hypothetical protein
MARWVKDSKSKNRLSCLLATAQAAASPAKDPTNDPALGSVIRCRRQRGANNAKRRPLRVRSYQPRGNYKRDVVASFPSSMQSISNDISHLSLSDPQAPDDSTTTPTLKRVPLGHDSDVFTDDDHKRLDADIMNAFRLFQIHGEEPDWFEILSRITQCTSKKLTPDDAKNLLRREPAIETVLRKAWAAKTFKQVRQLDILRPHASRIRKSPPVVDKKVVGER